MKKTPSARVIKELDDGILRMFGQLELNGVPPTEAQKKEGLRAFKQSRGYKSVVTAIQNVREAEVEAVSQMVREQLFPAFRKPLAEFVKRLPYPKGGRSRLLSEEKKARARHEIAQFMENGSTFKDAVARVAQRFGVSARTMYRVWAAGRER